jgi:DNA polymerase III subunit epsilon
MPFLVLDLEMTGSEPGWNEIIQIGAVLYDDNWVEKGQFLHNVCPENEEAFTEYSEQVHNLSWSELQDEPLIFDVIEKMENWILDKLYLKNQKRPGEDNTRVFRDIIVCGQSVINDINFLMWDYDDLNFKWPYSRKLVDLHTLSYFTFMILEKNGKKVPKKLSLTAIAAHFGFEREEKTHNALEDAILTAKCFKEIFAIANRLTVNS